jgi:tetratricopeptide (TPR) repeat protein
MRAIIRAVLLLFFSLCAAYSAAAQNMQMPAPPPPKLYSGMGSLHHKIATTNPEAQKFFDQGLTFIFAFNHEEAERSFRYAAELDPSAAMPYWGIALSVGPNYNMDVDNDREHAAYKAIQQARERDAGASESERAYIYALSNRYSDEEKPNLGKLAYNYSNAMRDVARKYPDDPDAAVIFAESLMDLHPWQLWSVDGKPNENTEEIVSTLEAVLRRWPDHIGANHYYIHALEASPHPEKALPSANRLGAEVPSAGHLVHMPAHIYSRTGNYSAAVKSNQDAIASDRAFLKETSAPDAIYRLMYLSHNVAFLTDAAEMNGQFAVAKDASQQLSDSVQPALSEMPMVEAFIPTQMFVLLRFARWDDILKFPVPDSKLAGTLVFWRFAQCAAFAAKGQVSQAETVRREFENDAAKLPPGPAFGMEYNDWSSLTNIASQILDARIAAAKGDSYGAIDHWSRAVAIQDKLNYDEPPEWYYPVRESLGAALLRANKPAEAEAVFREDLQHNPHNPRSLFGLWKSLEAQKKTAEAQKARQQFESAWKQADTQLRIEDF